MVVFAVLMSPTAKEVPVVQARGAHVASSSPVVMDELVWRDVRPVSGNPVALQEGEAQVATWVVVQRRENALRDAWRAVRTKLSH